MSTGPNEPETEQVDNDAANADSAPDVEPDTQSDPSLDDSTSTEWAGEGGATTEGPATETSDS